MRGLKKTVPYILMFILSSWIPESLRSQDIPAIELSGFTTPYITVNIGSGTLGIIDTIRVDRSDFVKKGEVVAVLESNVERARVDLAQAQLKLVDAGIETNQARLDFAKREYERKQALFRKDSISTFDRDEAETNMRIAEKTLREALEQKKVSAMEMKYAQEVVNRLTIHSPISGVVVERYLAQGELVNEVPIVKIAQLDPLNVEVIVPSTLWGTIKEGMKADILPEEPVGGNYEGTIKIVDKIIDAKSGTYGIRLEMPNPNSQLPAGLKCRVVMKK